MNTLAMVCAILATPSDIKPRLRGALFWLAVVFALISSAGCVSPQYEARLDRVLCTTKQYALYEAAGMEYGACDRDKRMFAYAHGRPVSRKQLEEAFTAFVKPRLRARAEARELLRK